jgi:NADP-dependent 3-hydroxy acid dehydrogenase YdfG
MTESLFYRNADFTSCDEEDERLLPEEIAQCVMSVLAMREGAVVTDITVMVMIPITRTVIPM